MFSIQSHCPDCFNTPAPQPLCRHCGFDLSQYADAIHYLPFFTQISEGIYAGRVLGEGGFGIVYCGWNDVLRDRIAVKEFFPFQTQLATRNRNSSAISPKQDKLQDFNHWRDRFNREARLLWQFRDVPSIINSQQLIYANGTSYLVMERLFGSNLEDHLGIHSRYTKRTLQPLSAVRLYQQILDILQLLHGHHDNPVYHRDISLRNIILVAGQIEQVKLLDFGLARSGEKTTQTPTAIAGTDGFASPEQMRGGHISACSDLYSLAAVIYTTLSGRCLRQPLSHSNDASITELDLPYGLSQALGRSLLLTPQQRPQSVAEVRGLLSMQAPGGQTLVPGQQHDCGQHTQPELDAQNPPHKNTAKKYWLALSLGVLTLAVLGVGYYVQKPAGRAPVAERISHNGTKTPEAADRTEPNDRLCLKLHYFNIQQAKTISSKLIALGAMTEVQRETQTLVEHLVYLPKFASWQEARKKAIALKKQGFDDIFIVERGFMKNGLLVGLFDDKNEANSLIKRLRELGENPKLEHTERENTRYRINVVISANKKNIMQEIENMRGDLYIEDEHLFNSEMRDCPTTSSR